jgi:hypothetical protein
VAAKARGREINEDSGKPRVSSVTSDTKVDRVRLVELLGLMRLDEERGAVWELMQCIKRCTQMFAETEHVELRDEFDEKERELEEVLPPTFS